MSGTLSEIASLIYGGSRSISSTDTTGATVSVIPDLTVRESHRDSLGITSHPVETGAAITDHAFKLPAELRLEYGWSNASLKATFSNFSVQDFSVQSLLDGNWGESYCRQVYEKLIALQEARTLCQIVTGKRLYKNMLIESVETFTDASTAYSMFVSASCREILIVNTVTATTNVTTSNQARPQSTAPLTEAGQKQLKAATNTSALSSLWAGIKAASGY